MAKRNVNDEQAEQILEECMKFIGFKLELLTPECVQGRFVVNERSCQPFGVLHGGVSALISESLASRAAHNARGLQRVAGIELNINHLKAAPIGTEVFASATPVHIGERLHVWEVTLSKVDESAQSASEHNPGDTKISVSRVTLMVGLSGQTTENNQHLKTHARL